MVDSFPVRPTRIPNIATLDPVAIYAGQDEGLFGDVGYADTPAVLESRTDVNAFIEYALTDIETREPLRQADIHRAWHSHIDAHSRALILAPREHGKTEQIVIGRVLWELGRNPQLRIKIVCDGDDTAVKRLGAIQGHISRNPRLKAVFPHLRPHPDLSDWTKHTATVSREGEDKDPSLEACGVLTAGVGSRADLIIFDDVVNLKNAILQPALREQVKESFRNVWLNLLTPRARAVYIATPWHEDDLTHELERDRAWACLRQPIPESMEPIWWERWPPERLRAKLKEVKDRAFSRGWRLVALSDEDALFRNVIACIRPDLSRAHIRDHWPRYTGVDLGHSRRKVRLSGPEKPYSVIFTVAVDERGHRWPVEVRRGHWTGPQTALQIFDVYHTHDPESIVIENNAYQDTLLDWLRLAQENPDALRRDMEVVRDELSDEPLYVDELSPAVLPLIPFTTGAQKADEIVGLPGLAAEFDGLSWIIPTDGVGIEDVDGQRGPLWVWINEMKGYPVAPLSDTVMACWFAREATRPKFQLRGPFSREKLEAMRAACEE